MKLSKSVFFASALACLGALPAFANVVTSAGGITNGTNVPFVPVTNYFGGGPVTVAPGITWSSTNVSNQGGSVYAYDSGYGFNSNGFWDNSMDLAGVNDSFGAYGVTDTMTFSFSSAVSGVGGFLNYVPYGSTPATIAVYDSGHNLIESTNLTFITNGGADQGQFLGFQEATADISYFTLSDNYVAITNLTVASAAPEAPSWAVVILAFGALLGAGLKLKRSEA